MASSQYDRVIKLQEPNFDDLKPENPKYKSILADCLNWVNYLYTPKQLKEFTLNYLKSKNVEHPYFNNVEDYYFVSTGKHAYILMRNGQLSEFSIAFFNDNVEKLKRRADEIKRERSQIKVVASQTADQLSKRKINSTIERIEDLVINKIYEDNKDKVLEYVREAELTKQEIEKVGLALKELYQEVSDKSDPDIVENIELMGKEKATYIATCLIDAMSLLQMEHVNKTTKTRKPRTRKEKDATKVVKNIKHKPIDQEYNIVSIDPSKIVGATALLVFNTKLRRVGLYEASEGNTLSLKGTTLQNYDEDISLSKTLRKAKDDLVAFRTAHNTKRIKVLYGNIRGKTYKLNGRINKDTLLLKVF